MGQLYKLYSISRLRMLTDGAGVTSLVASVGCPLSCVYCINKNVCDSEKGRQVNCQELYDMLKQDNLYYLATGGGITFGGGEPLLYADFLQEFIEKYKTTGWKFCVESSLNISRELLDKVIGLFNFYIIDIKDMDKLRYKKYTSGEYDTFYNNLIYLIETVGSEKIKVRVPYIEGYNTREQQLENERILNKMGFENIELFDYIVS